MERSFQGKSDIAVLFIYFNYKEQGQSTANVLGALLQQLLVQQSMDISDRVSELYHRLHLRKTRPSISEYSEALQSEISRFSSVFLVLDALDECLEEDGTRTELIAEIKKLHTTRILITSRPHIMDIERDFEHTPRLDIHANDEDVRHYLTGRIKKLSRLKRCIDVDLALEEEITNTIVQNVKGMCVTLAIPD